MGLSAASRRILVRVSEGELGSIGGKRSTTGSLETPVVPSPTAMPTIPLAHQCHFLEGAFRHQKAHRRLVQTTMTNFKESRPEVLEIIILGAEQHAKVQELGQSPDAGQRPPLLPDDLGLTTLSAHKDHVWPR